MTTAASAALHELVLLRRVRDPAGNHIRIQETPTTEKGAS